VLDLADRRDDCALVARVRHGFAGGEECGGV